MSDLIFNMRIYKYHFKITRNLTPKINVNNSYNFNRDPFIIIFKAP